MSAADPAVDSAVHPAVNPAVNPAVDLLVAPVVGLADAYVAAARVDAHGRRQAVRAFQAEFGDLQRWRSRPAGERLAVSEEARAFASFAAVGAGLAVDAEYVVASASKWDLHVTGRDPEQSARFRLQATSLGFAPLEVAKMWSKLAQICVITGQHPDTITAADYLAGRDAFAAAVEARHDGTSPKSLRTPLFGLNAVMFHRGQAPRPVPRRPWAARSPRSAGRSSWAGRRSWPPPCSVTSASSGSACGRASRPPCASSPGTSSPTAT